MTDDCVLSPGVSMEDDENWCSQINRLQQLLDKLECQVFMKTNVKDESNMSTERSYFDTLVLVITHRLNECTMFP